MKTILALCIPAAFGFGIWSGQALERHHQPTNEQMLAVVTGAAELGWRCHDVNPENTIAMCKQAVFDLIQVKK